MGEGVFGTSFRPRSEAHGREHYCARWLGLIEREAMCHKAK